MYIYVYMKVYIYIERESVPKNVYTLKINNKMILVKCFYTFKIIKY